MAKLKLEAFKNGAATIVLPASPLSLAILELLRTKPVASEDFHRVFPGDAEALGLIKKNGKPVLSSKATDALASAVYCSWFATYLQILKGKDHLWIDPASILPEWVLKAVEHQSRLGLAELELWKALFDLGAAPDRYGQGVSAPFNAWQLTQHEWIIEDYAHMLRSVGQRAIRATWRDRIKKLEYGRNPFDSNFAEAHRYNLLEASLLIASRLAWDKKSQAFYPEKWLPYVNAYRRCLRYLRDGAEYQGATLKPHTLVIEGSSIKVSGSEKLQISLPQSNFFKSGRGAKPK